jgi:hypothetical protein
MGGGGPGLAHGMGQGADWVLDVGACCCWWVGGLRVSGGGVCGVLGGKVGWVGVGLGGGTAAIVYLFHRFAVCSALLTVRRTVLDFGLRCSVHCSLYCTAVQCAWEFHTAVQEPLHCAVRCSGKRFGDVMTKVA